MFLHYGMPAFGELQRKHITNVIHRLQSSSNSIIMSVVLSSVPLSSLIWGYWFNTLHSTKWYSMISIYTVLIMFMPYWFFLNVMLCKMTYLMLYIISFFTMIISYLYWIAMDWEFEIKIYYYYFPRVNLPPLCLISTQCLG